MKSFLTALTFLPICWLQAQELNPERAAHLLTLPLKCIHQEYPNKLSQVLNDQQDLAEPQQLHPAFYGCFDWHSSVHGHWLLVKLLKTYPELQSDSIIQLLHTNINPENIQQEIAFFETQHNGSFERTYGWNWLLKLQLELDSWEAPDGVKMANALRPLSDSIVQKYIRYLPKLNYPIRSGDHINTAFGLTFAYDYALATTNEKLCAIIVDRAKYFFLSDKNYPLYLEPGGYDFLSPGFEEIDLMQRILPEKEFRTWLKGFAPQLFSKKFNLKPGVVSDRTDGHLVHLDGLNFSRAWCISNLILKLPELKHLKSIAEAHLNHSLPNIVDGDYMGEHWLASFAINALLTYNKLPK